MMSAEDEPQSRLANDDNEWGENQSFSLVGSGTNSSGKMPKLTALARHTPSAF